MLRLIPRETAAKDWPRPRDISPLLHRLLRLRGVESEQEARAFLHPDLSLLHDPFLLSDMAKATDAIREAMRNRESICVYGDYDVDGVCACAILTGYLKAEGARADTYLPSRHQEGYGLNEAAVRQIAQSHQLLVTVDCGITASALVSLARELGLKTVITDHHRPEGALPDCPVVNPLLNNYPFGYLCGAGVAFQLVSALGGREKAMEFVDFAALATIADIVPLMDENRALAAIGLKKINAAPRPGIRALIDASGLSGKPIKAGNVAFQLTPRLNASGRIGDASRAYELLTSGDIDRCIALAGELNEENARRKDLEQRAIDEAEKMLADFDFPAHRVIVAAGEGWNPGVIGLAASRLTEKYRYPSVVLTREGDIYTGSCRSIEEIDIHDALSHVSEHLLQFGGHRMAAGLKLRADQLSGFQSALDEYLFSSVDPDTYIPRLEYDDEVTADALTPEAVYALEALSPPGCQNPAPLFRMRCEVAGARAVGASGAHLKLSLRAKGGTIGGIWFRMGERANDLPPEADALFAASINEYQGRVSVQAEMRALAPASSRAQLAQARAEALFQAFLTDIVYNGRDSGEESRPISFPVLREMCEKHPQGVLLVAADAQSARAALEGPLAGLDFDIAVGAYPKDARCFRAVAVAPRGACPKGYRTVVLLDAPEGLIFSTHRVSCAPLSPWFARLPQTDELRKVYVCARRVQKRPYIFANLDTLAVGIAEEADIGLCAAAAGLLVLRDMALLDITFGAGGIRLEIPEMVKRDPTQNEWFKRMSAWRETAKKGGGWDE